MLSNVETWLAAQQVSQMQAPVEIRDDIDEDDAANIVKVAYGDYHPDAIEEAQDRRQQL